MSVESTMRCNHNNSSIHSTLVGCHTGARYRGITVAVYIRILFSIGSRVTRLLLWGHLPIVARGSPDE